MDLSNEKADKRELNETRSKLNSLIGAKADTEDF